MRPFLRKLLPRLALALFAAVLVAVALEMAWRFLPALQPREEVLDRPGLFYGFQPHREHPWAEGASNVLRVVVIGDSFAAGMGVEIDDTFGCRLERLLNLNENTVPAAVEIYAKCGSSTADQLDFLDKAFDWGAEIVVLSICLNDTEDWSHPDTLMRLREDIFPRDPPRYLAWLTRRSRFARALYYGLETMRTRRAYVRYYEHIYDPGYPGWARFGRAVAEFRRRCDERGVKLVALVFPLLGYDLSRQGYPFHEMHERIAAVMEEQKVPCLDLRRAFMGLDPLRMEVIPHVDEHPDEIAHRIAAVELFRFMLQHGIVDKSYKPARTRQRAALEIWRHVHKRLHGEDGAARD